VASSEYQTAFHVISWNLKHLGRHDMDFDEVAEILKTGDIIAFQEVNTSEEGKNALNRIAQNISKLTHEKICQGWSEIPTGATERYGYLWRNKIISYVKVNGEIVGDCPSTAITIRLGVKNAERIVREPAYGTFYFKPLQKHFVLASIHLVPEKKNPAHEVAPLFDTFDDVKMPVIIAGDYNLSSTNSAFVAGTGAHFKAALINVKTSLKRDKREYNKPFDNFWFREIEVGDAKVIDIYGLLDWSSRNIYKKLSDHAPIEATVHF
jgi:endonuclease/exonuclease/phosphatase family metal-dependent hydrolase